MISYKVQFGYKPESLNTAFSAAEKIVAVQMLKDTRPFVPALTMNLNNRVRLIGSHIIYPGPYARYLWCGKVMVNAKTGKGPMKIPGVGYRWPKGATLKATSRPLKYTKTLHPKATDHWTEVSEKQNIEKWDRVIRKAVSTYVR